MIQGLVAEIVFPVIALGILGACGPPVLPECRLLLFDDPESLPVAAAKLHCGNSADEYSGPLIHVADSGEGNFWNRDALSGSWGGLRPWLKERGVSVGIDWFIECFLNMRGGIKKGVTTSITYVADLSLNMKKLLGISGSEIYFRLEGHAGSNPSTVLVGDLQVFDKLNFSPYFQVSELWYQQKLFSDRLRFKAGKIDESEVEHTIQLR